MTGKIDITAQDISNAVAIIDICVKRGAIEGSELTTVGTIRDKLSAYVKQETITTEEDTAE